METTVYNLQGQESGKISLPDIFEKKVSPALLHEVVVGYLANQRAGTHQTKTRGEVSGGGRKPWREKGTGNARAGSNRSPLWRKGGIIFGPHPRSYFQNLPQKKRALSLEMALSLKASEGNLMVIDALTLADMKTKSMATTLKNLKVSGAKILLGVDKLDKNVKTASRNIENLVVTEAHTINTYSIMWAAKVILTKGAVEALATRLSGAAATK